MTATQTVYLNQTEYRVPPVIHAVQNDTGRSLQMVIMDVIVPASSLASLCINRSDGSYYTIECSALDTDNNSYTADITQALTQTGRCNCQLKVDGVSTFLFVIDVQKSTDGVPEEQLGYSVQDLMNASFTILNGISTNLKNALLQWCSKTAFVDENGQQVYSDLLSALNPPAILISITADYVQSGEVLDSEQLDSLKSDLIVTANYNNGQSVTLSDSAYTLEGNLIAGVSRISVLYENKYTTFTVVVTHDAGFVSVVNHLTNATTSNSATVIVYGESYSATITANSGYTLIGASILIKMGDTDITESAYDNGSISVASVTDILTISIVAAEFVVTSISAVYTQIGTVYDNATLDTLKSNLVVTATYSDGTIETIPSTDYVLSGTLTAGTSTITVSFGGKTTTFTVTVTHYVQALYPLENGVYVISAARTIEITNGNHVKVTTTGEVPTTGGQFLNFNDGTWGSGTNIVNNKPLWFTIPANTEAVFSISNVLNNNSYPFTMNFRKALATTSASFSSGKDAHLNGFSVTNTLATAEDIGCLFMYLEHNTSLPANSAIEFDVSLMVGEDKYI